MITTIIIGVIQLLVLVIVIRYYLRNKKFWSDLEKIPGPPPYPIIGNGLEFLGGPRQLFNNITRFAQEYGDVFKLWLPGNVAFVYLSDPDDIETLLSSNVHIVKSLEYKFFDKWLGESILLATGNKWRKNRKLITPAFHFKILEQFISIFDNKSSELVKSLEDEVGKEAFTTPKYIAPTTLDVVCETSLGESVKGFNDYSAAIKKMNYIFMRRMYNPRYRFDFFFNLSSLRTLLDKCLDVLNSFSDRVIRSRKEYRAQIRKENENDEKSEDLGKRKKLALLDLLIEYSKDGTQMTDSEIRDEVNTFVFAGHDTTTTAISFCLCLLGEHQDIQEEVFEEIESIFGGSDRELTSADLNEMKLLERVIKETMRIYPPVPLFARMLEEDLQLKNCVIPKGCMVGILTICLHRKEELFPDALKFDPDRFLQDNLIDRHHFAYVPFSAGPRNCIGQKFAMLEMKSVISKVLRHYKILKGSEEKNFQLLTDVILTSECGLKIRIQKRSKGANQI